MNDKRLSKAKVALMIHRPYFGMMASHLNVTESENQESFLSDGDALYINRDYLKSLSLDEMQFVLSNASMHRLLDHKGRQSGKMEWLWQLSTDYAINAMLVKNGMKAPERINYQRRFDGMYAEEIYALLKDEIKNESYDDDDNRDAGYNENSKAKQKEQPLPETMEQKSRSKIEADAQFQMAEAQHEAALSKAFEAGDVPLDLERVFALGVAGKENWREHLFGFIQMNLFGDYAMFPSNKKHLYRGVLLPSFQPSPKKLAIVIDTSGSVSEALLSQFVAEIEAVRLDVEMLEIELFAVDAKIQSHQSFHYGEPLELRLKGGGGTNLHLAFDVIYRENIDIGALLYFTDGEAPFPQEAPDYPVLWVLSQPKEIPFGESVVIK